IKAMSKSIETHEEIAQVATIAANDPDIGETIATVLDHVGRDGIITVEEGRGLTSEIEYIKGMQFDRGYISSYMATNKERMEDIAIMTGGRVISEKRGTRLQNTIISDLGTARSVTTTKDSTLIIDGGGSQEAIQARMRELRAQLANGVSDFDREKLQQRLANLSGGVGVIKVGAATEVEMKEKKLRTQDALAATRAALEEGIVPGGGVALVIALPALDSIKTKLAEEMTGVNILRRALEEPLHQIAENAGYEGPVVVANVRERPFGYGFDATTGQYVDMFQAGIVDPVKV